MKSSNAAGFWIVTLMSAVVLSCASPVQAESGLRLGSVQLAEGKDRDVVRLPACHDSFNAPIHEIRLHVSKHPAELDLIRVFFHNGETQQLHVKQHFGKGDSSRWIDLRGRRRCVERIVVVGDTDTPGWRPGKQARITFFGR